MKADRSCTLCALHKTAPQVCVLGSGPKTSDIMVITESPREDDRDRVARYNGRVGSVLEEALEDAGINPEDVYVCPAVSCHPPDGKAPTKAQVKHCKAWVDHQIQAVRPKFVLLLGNTPLLSVTGGVGIKSKRGRPFEQDGIIYVPTWHPNYLFHDPGQENTFHRDIGVFASIIEKGEIPREDNLDIIMVTNPKRFKQMLRALRGTVSFDIETNCLYPWQTHNDKGEECKARINSIGFGTRDKQFILPMFHDESPWSAEALDDMVEAITGVLDRCFLVAHNGKFDFLWMLVHFGVKWYEHFQFDTMLAHYAADENDLHGLKYLAQKFLGAPDWEIDKDEKKGAGTLEKLSLYHAHDLYYTRQLRFKLGKMLKRDLMSWRIFDRILMPCARLFVEVEYNGVFIEVDKLEEAEKVLREQFDDAQKNLAKWGDINWGSPKQLGKLLFEDLGLPIVELTKTGNPSCSESVIKRIDHPCAGDLLKFREAKQQLSFFIDGWKPWLHKRRVNGHDYHYLHPSFKLHGTVTGRLSCENPNLQQVPRDPRIRTLINAEEGWTFVECDLSQIELRIAAELANEPAMLWAFENGIDVHWLTAISEIERGGGLKELVLDTARTWKQDKSIQYAEAIEVLIEMGPDEAIAINFDWKEHRKKAKAINFGYLYGMWWKKFKLYARDNYGVIITDDQAQESRTSFFEKYQYEKWHKKQKQFARRNGYVRSLSGRKRRLPKALLSQDTPERRAAERQAVNSPVQSFGNEINLMALIEFREIYSTDVVRICGTVHDSIIFRVRNDMVEEATGTLIRIMSRPSLMDEFDIQIRVPLVGEGSIGPWGKGVDFHKWKAQQRRRGQCPRSSKSVNRKSVRGAGVTTRTTTATSSVSARNRSRAR